MATSEERMKILRMIDEGKISATDGARLLAALTESRRAPRRPMPPGPGGGGRWLRIRVTDTRSGRAKATVNLPLGLFDTGVNIAAQYVPGINFEDLAEAVKSGVEGKIIDVVDEEDGEHVEIYIE